MGVSTILSVLLATLLSDAVTCGRVRRTEYGPAKDAAAPEVSPSHGRTFVNFDSSPALTHLEFNGGPSNVHHRGVHGVPVVPPKPAEPSWELGEYDYAEYDQNYPHWHQVHPFHGHNVNAAPTLWPDFNELRQMTTKQPPSAHSTDAGRRTVDLSEFDPTHSFVGSMFTDSSDTGKGTKSSPPVASTTQAIGSSADKDSPSKSTTPGEESQAVSTTSVQLQESHGDHGKALKDGAPFATTVIESLLQQGVGSTATPTLSSPTVGNKSTETTTNPSVGTTSTAMGVAQGSSEPPTKPDAPRETGSTRGSAAVPVDSSTTVSFREPGFTDTHPKFNGSEGAHTGVTSTATGTDSKFTSSTIPAPPADFVARQAAVGTVASSSKPTGGFARLPTPPEAGVADKIVETTTERAFPNTTTGSRPLPPQTSANETEIPARQPVFKNTPPDNTSQTSPSVVKSTEPSKLATSPRETQTPVQHVDFRNETSDFPATPATKTPFAVSEVAGLSNRPETTTHPSLATSTALDERLQNRATAPLTRAPVENSNETSTVSQRPVEPSTLRPTSPAITAGVRQATTTTTTSSPTTTEPALVLPTAQGGQVSPAQSTLARNAAFKQTLPTPSRPVHPATTASPPPVTADAYVRPITQHGVHEFVPQRHRDVEDYFYHHQSGRVEDDQLRTSPCGKCQRRLHYCVQKCFVHHSCEAETNPELTCPRINAPCMPPYKHEVDQCRHSADCETANHLCCLVGCSRRCVHGVPTQH